MRCAQSWRRTKELFPECAFSISRFIATAPLQFRDQQINDIDKGLRPDGEGQIETVHVGFLDPFLQGIRRRLR